jgi:hypothetical protein
MAEHSGPRTRAPRTIIPSAERVRRTSFTLPIDVVDFLRAQRNADNYVTELIRREIKKAEIPGK